MILLESVHARNFQSLHDIELEFGKFTTIVGPSSSGKSAVTRALKAVTSNALNEDYISRGTKHASVTVDVDSVKVTIEREIGDSSVYKISRMGSEEPPYSKLNRKVPAQVTEALGILPSTQEVGCINFAGQFDSPYLLTQGASSVAKILGELTNVSKIFNAVKEANRRTKNASGLVNLRKKDEAALKADLLKFAEMGQMSKDVTQAEVLIASAGQTQAQLTDLTNCLQDLESSSKILAEFLDTPELPDLDDVLLSQINLNKFKDLARTMIQSQKTVRECDSAIAEAISQIEHSEDELHKLLLQAGTCPTCNQDVL